MKLGFIGLGKMGYRMVQNLLDHKYEVVVYNRSQDSVNEISQEGAQGVESVEELVNNLLDERIIWLMLPAGTPVDETIEKLLPDLNNGDIIIDGGNSHYKDTIKRAEYLKSKGIELIDVGTSGGLEGARHGACMMIGGNKKTFDTIEQLFKDMCIENGYGYVGTNGAGHFVKMIHNGVEYGMMQAIGEGFNILDSSFYDLDLEDIARIWANGSVIRGWLMDLTKQAFSNDPKLLEVNGQIADSGEGKWTIQAALDLNVSIPVISSSLMERYRSRESNTMSNKVVASLRDQFGGHGFVKNKVKQ